MNNYEYIIASLPVLTSDWRGELDSEGVLAQLRSLLSRKDEKALDLLLKGFDTESLGEEFYRSALSSSSAFIREYFAYDLDVRNCKVAFLNKSLSRPEGQDVISLEEDREFEGAAEVMAVLEGSDILGRERGLDDLMWKKIDEVIVLDVFSLDVILAFVCKLQIVERWLKLDEQSGRELFATLVNQIRQTSTINK